MLLHGASYTMVSLQEDELSQAEVGT